MFFQQEAERLKQIREQREINSIFKPVVIPTGKKEICSFPSWTIGKKFKQNPKKTLALDDLSRKKLYRNSYYGKTVWSEVFDIIMGNLY